MLRRTSKGGSVEAGAFENVSGRVVMGRRAGLAGGLEELLPIAFIHGDFFKFKFALLDLSASFFFLRVGHLMLTTVAPGSSFESLLHGDSPVRGLWFKRAASILLSAAFVKSSRQA